MKSGFNKTNLLAALDRRRDHIEQLRKFDPRNGYAQLLPRRATHDEVALIERAIDYGKYCAWRDFAEAIEEGFQFEQEPQAKGKR
jgi:hypothetical protein